MSEKNTQKQNLKTLVENSSVSKVRSAGRIVKYGAASFKRNIWLSIAATLVMTITLIILLVTVGASLILSSTADAMRQKIDITVYFKPGTELSVLKSMSTEMRADPNVRELTVADSAMEYQALLDENSANEALIAALDDEEMYQAMLGNTQATMRIKVYDPDKIDGIKNIVETHPSFQEHIDTSREPTYEANRAQITTISSWATIAKNGGLILGAVFLVISILVIFNTIRMAIFSRREEIYMMKLVGADPGFIRGPFLIEAQISGIISGLLAATAAYFGFQLIHEGLASYGIDISTVSDLLLTNRLVIVYLITVALGILVGSISARLAMQKHLK